MAYKPPLYVCALCTFCNAFRTDRMCEQAAATAAAVLASPAAAPYVCDVDASVANYQGCTCIEGYDLHFTQDDEGLLLFEWHGH